MKLSKILIYDNGHYFSRLVKYKFKKDFDFKVFKNFDRVENFDDIENVYSIIVFVIYSETDLFDFIRIYKKGVQVVVATHDKEILKKMTNINDILLFDISIKRLEILEEVKRLFSMCSFLPQLNKVNLMQVR
ncbi:hypothetical protein [Flavobacterium collinsii]|uniref:RCK N-terminal domain-containing protein n=1 Tax=Flavobacterium collinsii TaxID=1114861 RepID=A0ABM8KQU7_9FLAO|nr:hypothetical protein [Flavobacterium collinsii]CAA9203309.1 hypothetical protein FLACOL7796_04692 [Flavobacterium collinsii]